MTNFENGVASYGIPQIGQGLPVTNGRYLFVSSVTGNSGNKGLTIEKPLATIASAVSRSLVNDVIIVLPGHTETVASAGGIDFNVAGVSVVGLGVGNKRPVITFSTSTAADMNIDADGVSIYNCVLDLTGVDALTAPIDVNAADFTFQGNKVITASSSAQATLAILTDANASRMRVINNEFIGTTDAGTATAIRIVGGNEHVIDNNRFYGAYTTSLGAIENNTTACLRVKVTNNLIQNATASSTKAMVFDSSSTGVISGNMMQILSGTAPITGAAMSWVGGNYYAAAVATAGTLI